MWTLCEVARICGISPNQSRVWNVRQSAGAHGPGGRAPGTGEVGVGVMTRITTGCPRCGRVELDVEEVVLVMSPREDTSWYLFDCVGCARRVVKPAPTTVAVALTTVRTTVWVVPAEVLERVEPHEQPAIAVDDLLDAMLLLARDADLVALAAGGPGTQPGTGAPGRVPGPGGITDPRSGAAGSPPARPGAA